MDSRHGAAGDQKYFHKNTVVIGLFAVLICASFGGTLPVRVPFPIIRMDSKRQQKFSRLIQKELGDIFQREGRSHFGNVFITVTRVEVSPDLGVAKVYLSFMLAPSKQLLLEDIREKNKFIRQNLGNRIRNQARIIPELVFFLDETAEYAAKMDTLIAGLNIPPAPEEDPNDDTYHKK